eukprot:jgi/Botrbrau1/13152/Bobra.0187s0100.1
MGAQTVHCARLVSLLNDHHESEMSHHESDMHVLHWLVMMLSEDC